MDASLQVFLDGRVQVWQGDITQHAVEAIVNAANSSLLGGGGVDGAIHRAGGPEILAACREIRRTTYPQGLPTGKAVMTTGGQLPARFVIHTVGPIFGEAQGKEAELLGACYRNSLRLAAQHGLTSLAFPAISTGIYGYPRSEAAAVASQAIASSLESDDRVREVRLVFYAAEDTDAFLNHHAFPK